MIRIDLGKFLLFGLVAAMPSWCQSISTVAGNSSWGRIFQAGVDSAGNLYTPDYDNAVVYKTDRFGSTSTIAGTGTAGYSGDGGTALNARLSRPAGVAVTPDGVIYIGDSGNDRIRKITPSGIITTYAGTGTAGFAGDGGPAASARLNGPFTLALDGVGALYFVDYENHRVRKIKTDGTISTVAGSGATRYAGDSGLATASSIFPGWIYVTPDGTIYLTDDGLSTNANQRVRKVATNGTISTVAGSGTIGYAGDGGPATAAVFNTTAGVAADLYGNVYIADADNARIRKVTPNGLIATFAGTGKAGFSGDGGAASAALLNHPSAMTIDSDGNLFVVDQAYKRIRKITPAPVPLISATDSAVSSFLGKSAFSSNTYVEIYGSNLAATTRTWSGSDFQGSNAPTTLDGVSVTVNGKAAFVYFVSPGQININTPDDSAIGPVVIQVKNLGGHPKPAIDGHLKTGHCDS